MTILVTGSRGAIGRSLVGRLHAAGVDVRAAGRVPEALDLPVGVATTRLDLAAPGTDLGVAFSGVSAVFLYADPAGIDEVIAAAVDAGVPRVVLLSSDSVAMPAAEHNAIARRHLLVERALDASPLTTVFLRPGTFASLALRWADTIRAGQPIDRPYPDAVLSPLHSEDIADVAELALTSEELDGRSIWLHGPEALTVRDQLTILGDALGTTIDLREQTPERAREAMRTLMPADMVEALLEYWAYTFDHPASTADRSSLITGRRSRAFREFVDENLDAFR